MACRDCGVSEGEKNHLELETKDASYSPNLEVLIWLLVESVSVDSATDLVGW